jgi:hypothetical protein
VVEKVVGAWEHTTRMLGLCMALAKTRRISGVTYHKLGNIVRLAMDYTHQLPDLQVLCAHDAPPEARTNDPAAVF